jgi:hypothetical protein
MRKIRWVTQGLLVCIFIGSGAIAQAKDPPTQVQSLPTISFITPETITRGDTITITGTNLSKNRVETIVKIDGQQAKHVEEDSAERIKVRVDTDPRLEARKSAGEYERSVVVIVDEQQSGPYTLHQLTWEVVLKIRVLVPMLLYLAIVAMIVLGVRASVFRSETGQLSLSKIQMGMWTFVFGLAYVFLAATWKEFLDLTDGMFWLMGISSATAVGAKAIVLKNEIDPKAPFPSTLLNDYDKNSASFKVTERSLEYLKSEGVPDDVCENLKSKSIKDKEFMGEEEFLGILEKSIGSEQIVSFKSSILKHAHVEKSGYRLSLHRCQIILWTLIVLVIYVIKLIGTMHLPDIPDKLLVLMGISGSTYLGFNYPKPGK